MTTPTLPTFRDGAQAHWNEAIDALRRIYGSQPEFDLFVERIRALLAETARSRPEDLRQLYEQRMANPRWYLRADQLAYSTYLDRFAGDLRTAIQRITYLKRLGVTYLHLLPIMKMRSDQNDSGFAVSDYRLVDPRFGDNDDLVHLGRALRQNDISLCLDFVCNHTSENHPWAEAAKSGDSYYRDFYHVLTSEAEKQRFEAGLSEIFPESAPGNFTFCEAFGGWVWTTFYPYQWDLNFANPNVFEAMLGNLLYLANLGVEVFRVDAAPYLWKRAGSECFNEPEVFDILRAFRALLAIATPAVIFKGEAIAPARQTARYLSKDGPAAPPCHIAYQASLMTASWAALASGDVTALTEIFNQTPQIDESAAWLTYVRCHDDIGWQVYFDDLNAGEQARASGLASLRNFYGGAEIGSFAEGVPFQAHGSIGTTASLCGLGKALSGSDAVAVDLAIDRILAMYALPFACGGIPLIWMGDEIGLLNDDEFQLDPRYDGDNRWLHRGKMPWDRLDVGDAVASRLFEGFLKLSVLRRRAGILPTARPLAEASDDKRAIVIRHVDLTNVRVAINVSQQTTDVSLPTEHVWRDLENGVPVGEAVISLPAYAVRWMWDR